MAELIWSERAIKDLDSIGKYIAIDSEYAAKKFIKELIKKASLLSIHPGKGRPIPENITGKYYIRAIELFTESKMKLLLYPQCIIRKDYYLKLTITKCPTEQSLRQ